MSYCEMGEGVWKKSTSTCGRWGLQHNSLSRKLRLQVDVSGMCVFASMESYFSRVNWMRFLVDALCVCVCVCVCARAHSHTQSCLTLCDPMDCSPAGSPVHGIFQARIVEHTAISLSRGFSQLKNLYLSCLLHWPAGSLPAEPSGKPHKARTSCSFI